MCSSVGIICLLPAACCLMPGKLEWVTPKISLMVSEETDGKPPNVTEPGPFIGPS